ncbi:alpha/beta fold hydrolase [Actinomadura macrotermitis]|uniref:AB hydrolase superfamily protein YdjP n=1 Tax=Actinomadura macrotermitis TaxID=2585200 RepID=A0A7K0BRB1_9ACTN|nr:alpha/beta hydrolase [Actinomadura macrotermitis]MQY03720.1 AB hydrolase superfamily protein YdjP [Actinomadura macrotermitis]
MGHVEASDGTRLHYRETGSGTPLVMIHGWTFSGRFFDRNAAALAEHARVVTIDLRGHGDSGKPRHGYRVSRLAKDLWDLMEALDLRDATLLGWSLGCPVVWSYLELFGAHRTGRAVFVEQTPRQYYAVDWKYAHAACFDDAALAALQVQQSADPYGQDEQQLQTIMDTEPDEARKKLFLAEMAKCPPRVRNAVMAAHTREDWRDVLPTFDLPVLVLVARQDRVFDWRGPAWAGEHVPDAETVFFEKSGHALFLDEPEKFDHVVARFHTEKRGEA